MKTLLAAALLLLAGPLVSGPVSAQNDLYQCDKKFIFFPGGPEGGPFASVVYNGAVAAAQHTG